MAEYQFQFSDKVGLNWVIEKMPAYLFPDLSKKKDRINKPFLGVIATLEKSPVGLLLATYDDTGKQARLHSLVVHPDHRNKGVGTKLVATLEESVRKTGASKLDLYFRSHWKHRNFLEKILENATWNTPKEDLIIVRGLAKKVLKLFMHNRIQLPENYQFVPFLQLNEDDRTYIKRKKREENWYLDYLDPFVQEASIFPEGSIALKFDNVVIGWVISHLIAPNLNEFTALFVDAQHRPFKLAHLLMREAIMRQDKAAIPKFLITSKTDNYVMSRFLLRHAEETEVFLTKSLYSFKNL
ncbi:MAG: GNAT family N-acetyltransferase [Saprospiraceae bacterium]|nr:GNAT family N-acetyltransferase [Saprospiraceae bacterium]